MAVALGAMAFAGCSRPSSATATAASTADNAAIEAAPFDADSAYAAVKAQVDMGPRVPGSEGHARCARWIEESLRRYGADTVIVQRATVGGPREGERTPVVNIMGRYNPEAASRVLIVAHWDTRPWADAETDEALHSRPIAGANDGASGVGVIMEIARQLSLKRAATGVDLLLVDAEDSGLSGVEDSEETWCLGSQYWSQHTPYGVSDIPRYAIVLDMVGGTGARFNRESLSVAQAPGVVDKVWATARAIGYGSVFADEPGGPLIDDHLFIQRAGIPSIDIVECRNRETGSFPPQWHTLADDLPAIDRASLKAAGQTVMTVIYNEKP